MHRYYNPALSAVEIEALDRENWLALMAVQAFLGAVSTNVLAVAVETNASDAATVHVAIREPAQEDEVEIEESLFSMGALLEGRIDLTQDIVIGDVPDAWRSRPYRLVFAARR